MKAKKNILSITIATISILGMSNGYCEDIQTDKRSIEERNLEIEKRMKDARKEFDERVAAEHKIREDRYQKYLKEQERVKKIYNEKSAIEDAARKKNDEQLSKEKLEEKLRYEEEMKVRRVETDDIQKQLLQDEEAEKQLEIKKVENQKIQEAESILMKKEMIKTGLKSLVAPKSTGPDLKESFDNSIQMEFTKKSKIYLNYNRVVIEGQPKSFSYDVNYYFNSSSGNLNLLSNNTVFKDDLAGRGYVSIKFSYDEDSNKNTRDSMIANKIDITRLKLDPEERIEQVVEFFMWDVKFKKILDMPQHMIIWNEGSKITYKCNLKESNFVHEGSSYAVRYNCPLLPNFKDYGDKIRLIFDYN